MVFACQARDQALEAQAARSQLSWCETYRFFPVLVSLMNPEIALYVPPTHPFTLNSMSASNPDSGQRTTAWSPSSYFILPKRMPRAYMLGCVMKLEKEDVSQSCHPYPRAGSERSRGLPIRITPARSRRLYSQSLAPVQESHDCNSLHKRTNTVSQELAARFESAVDSDAVFGSHEEV